MSTLSSLSSVAAQVGIRAGAAGGTTTLDLAAWFRIAEQVQEVVDGTSTAPDDGDDADDADDATHAPTPPALGPAPRLSRGVPATAAAAQEERRRSSAVVLGSGANVKSSSPSLPAPARDSSKAGTCESPWVRRVLLRVLA
jgi:hypothetical protein